MRNPLEQLFNQFALVVGTNPTPLNSNLDLSALITTFVLCVPSTAANNVFLGGGNVTINTGNNVGLEIIAGGGPQAFSVNQVRQLYELQFPLLRSTEALACQEQPPDDIPLIVWNPSNIYLVAVASTTIAVALFKEPFV